MREQVVGQLAFMDAAPGAHHCRGTKIIPFSMHNVDELLADIGVNLRRTTRASQWFNPVNPNSYRLLTEGVERRLEGTGSGATVGAVPAGHRTPHLHDPGAVTGHATTGGPVTTTL